MRLSAVVQHLRELLAQLVGARTHAIYVADEKRKLLVPFYSDGVELESLPRVQIVDAVDPPRGGSALLERVFLTGVPHIEEGALDGAGFDAPAACLPMRIEDRTIGVIGIFEVLPQKTHFLPVDFELFKMLAAQAATALAGAMLYLHADGKLPALDALRDFDPPRTA
jgi:GAF domain-containing protein